jgi:hypothetical protein
MSRYWDTGEVKARLSRLFKADVGSMKSAKLAGEMIRKHWGQRRGDNSDQQALSILVASANALFDPFLNKNELVTYLRCHQKVHRKYWWRFSIQYAAIDRYHASKWFMEKARYFAQERRQTQFLEALPSNIK